MLQGLLGIFSGLITPVQTAVNTRLGRSIGSPLRASLVSFSVGLIAMLTLTLLLGPYPLIPATAANGPWWMWFAGVFGVTFLTGNVLLLPKLGSLKTVIMPVTGQIVMGLLIDAFGWFGTTAQPISPLRIAGAAITLVGSPPAMARLTRWLTAITKNSRMPAIMRLPKLPVTHDTMPLSAESGILTASTTIR